MKEKYRAVLLNVAAGDRLGLPVENLSREQIRLRHGLVTAPLGMDVIKATRDDLDDEISDDTIWTLAIAESIVEKKGFDLNDIAKKHVDEVIARTQSDGKILGGFGGASRRAVKNLLDGADPRNSGIKGGAGNGPVMKISPIALLADAKNSEAFGLVAARAVGQITHLDPRSVAGGIIQTDSIYKLFRGVSREEFFDNAVRVGREFEDPLDPSNYLYEQGSLTERLEWIAEDLDRDDEEVHQEIGSGGLVYSSYPFTLFMFQKYWEDPVEGMVRLINFGGDTDTTGSIFGALVGARDGLVFPESWTDGLKLKERLIKAADGIYELGVK